MIRFILFFIVIHFLCLKVEGQNTPPGFRTVTSKKGTYTEYPKPDSKRYKIKISPECKIEYKLLFHEYTNGVYRENEKYLEHAVHHAISKGTTFIIEMVPELHNSERLFKIYFNLLGGVSIMRRKDASDENKRIKYVFFESFDVTSVDSSLPVLLAYEDDRETHEAESFIGKYLKNGVLPNTQTMLEAIRLHIKSYNLLFYTTKKMADEN